MLLRYLIDRQKRGHYRNDKTADYQTYDNYRRRPDEPYEPIEAALQFGVVEIGDSSRQHRQLAGVLAQTQCTHGHRRQRAGLRQRFRKLAALSHLVDQLTPNRRFPRRRHHIRQNAQARRQGHSARKQQPEIATKERGPAIAQHRTDERQALDRFLRRRPHCRPARQQKADRQQADDTAGDGIHVVAQKIGNSEKGHQDRIQLRVEILEDIGELRQDDQQEKQQHAASAKQQESGISQGFGQAPAQRFGALPLHADGLENRREITRRFAHARERDVNGRKDARVRPDRVGEAFAREDCGGDLRRRGSHAAEVRVARKQFQRVVDSRARAQQKGEIAGEDRDVFRPRSREDCEVIGALDPRLAFFRDLIDRDQTEIFDPSADLRRRRRRYRSADDLADLAQSSIAERRHGLTGWS